MSRFKSIIFAWVYFFVLSGINPAFAAMPATTIEAGKTYVFAGVAFKASQLDADGSGIGQASLPFLDEIFPVRFEQLRLDEWGNIHSGRIYAAIAPEGFHPQTPAELAEWRTTARLAGAVPRLLDQWAAAQEITLGGHSLWMTGFEINPEGIFADLAFIAETPEDQLLVFNKEQVSVGAAGLEWCSLELALQGPVNTNDPEFPIKIKGNAQGTESFVVFDCEGFKAFSLSCEYAFPTPMFKAVQTLDPVKARFTIFGKSFNNFIGTATVDPFTVEGLDGFSFTVKNAVVDYSTDSISTTMKSALGQINYANNGALQSNHADKVWRGFFVENVDISLPGVFKDKNQQNQPFSIGVKNLILDGTITGSVYAKPNIKTPGIEGWAISLDSVILEIVGSSITGDGVRVTGGVNIPITDSTMAYEATFNQGIKFVLDVAGEYRIPFLGNTKMELNNSSSATISVIGGKFVPSAIFNGKFIVKAGKFELPALGFEEFKINDQTMQSLFEGTGSPTAGLDKISFKAFSIGGVTFNANAPATTSQTNQATSQTNQANLQGFPVYFNNLGFNKEQYTSYYRLTFKAGINLIGAVDAFKADGTFSIRGEVDFDALARETPWDVIKFKDIQMEGFAVNASFGIFILNGCIAQVNDNTKEEFQGGIKFTIKLNPSAITVASSAIFGLNFGDDTMKGTSDDFRYFYVDASVEGMEIPIPSTGISLYGFKGGLYYNMTNASLTRTDTENLDPANIPCAAVNPGYTAVKGTIGFLAGVVLGITGTPTAFVSDVTFGIEFNTEGTFGLKKIYFDGKAYIMSESLADREGAAISLCLYLEFADDILQGSLGGDINLVKMGNEYLISGNIGNCKPPITISFDFRKEKYFFFIGKPQLDARATLNMDLKILTASAGIYFYFSNIPNDPVLSNIPTLESIFNASGFNGITPPNITKTGQVNGGIAFGMKTVIEGGFDFLFMSASLTALLGFDLSLTNQRNATCSFNGWKLQGQAYGGFMGNLDMNVDLWFYKGKINVASITMAAGLEASLPEEPVYLSGFLAGQYSALNDLISGDFNFKFEAGQKCSNSSGSGQLDVAKIPLIKDIWPASGQTIEIYQNPTASFFLPIGNTKYFNIKNGDETYSEIGITPNILEMKVVGPGVKALSAEIKNDGFVAVTRRESWLEPNSTYHLRLKLEFVCSQNCELISGPVTIDTTVTFRTGAFPTEINYEMFKAAIPGEDQKYWHKGYSEAIMEFEQGGFCSFFPKDTLVSLIFYDDGNTAKSLCFDRWDFIPLDTPETINLIPLPINYSNKPTITLSSALLSNQVGGQYVSQNNGNSGRAYVNYSSGTSEVRSSAQYLGDEPNIAFNSFQSSAGWQDGFLGGGSNLESFGIGSRNQSGGGFGIGTGPGRPPIGGPNPPGPWVIPKPPSGPGVPTMPTTPLPPPNPTPGGIGGSNGSIEIEFERKRLAFCNTLDKAGVPFQVSKRVPFIYYIQLTDRSGNSRLIPATIPNSCNASLVASIQEETLGRNFKVLRIVTSTNPVERQIAYEQLNELELNKGEVYKLALIRKLGIDPILISKMFDQIEAKSEKVLTTFGDSTNMVIQGYKLSNSTNVLMAKTLREVSKEVILYPGHHFGVSKYTSLTDKVTTSFGSSMIFQDINITSGWQLPGSNPTDWIKAPEFTSYVYNLSNGIEYYDFFDYIKIINNLEPDLSSVKNTDIVNNIFSTSSPYCWDTQRGLIIDRLFKPYNPSVIYTKKTREKCLWGDCEIERTFQGAYVDAPRKITTINGNSHYVLNKQISNKGLNPILQTEWSSFVKFITDPGNLKKETVFQLRLFDLMINSELSMAQSKSTFPSLWLSGDEKRSGKVSFNLSGGIFSFQFVDNTPRYLFNNLSLYSDHNYWISLLRNEGYGPSQDQAENNLYIDMFQNLPSWERLIQNSNINNTNKTINWISPGNIPEYIYSKHNGSIVPLSVRNKY